MEKIEGVYNIIIQEDNVPVSIISFPYNYDNEQYIKAGVKGYFKSQIVDLVVTDFEKGNSCYESAVDLLDMYVQLGFYAESDRRKYFFNKSSKTIVF